MAPGKASKHGKVLRVAVVYLEYERVVAGIDRAFEVEHVVIAREEVVAARVFRIRVQTVCQQRQWFAAVWIGYITTGLRRVVQYLKCYRGNARGRDALVHCGR